MASEPTWVRRFHATSISFPQWARDAPYRAIYLSNTTGTTELYAWDRRTDRHRRLTARPEGTTSGRISPDGETVWWFADSDGDELGRWMTQPFDGGADTASGAVPAVPDLAPGYQVGLALGSTVAAIGLSTRKGVRVHLHRFGSTNTLIYAAPTHAWVRALSRDERLLAIEHGEQGDAFHPAVRVIRLDDGKTVGELSDGPGRGLRVVGFAPGAGDSRLLLRHERSGRPEPLIWDLESGECTQPRIELSGELGASWYPDGRTLLLERHWQARDELYRYDLRTERLTRLDTPRGVVHGSGVRPDGTVEYLSSSAESPPVLRSGNGVPMLAPPRSAPPSVPLADAFVDGPEGAIHALVARPDTGGPVPTVFWLHGGPGGEMVDSFYAVRAAFVDAGYGVIHVNYRGSSGYGARWRDALRPRPGLIELEDIAAVRDWAVEEKICGPEQAIISGKSWGGYLTLLGLGTQPDRWAAGIADVPIGDMVALYEDEMEPVREHDRSLFGGTPSELPDKWARSSPITYAHHVKAPLLVIAGRNDPRCPIRQVENYLGRLDELRIPYEVDLYDAGHMSLVVAEQVRQMRLQLDFCHRFVPAPPPSS